MKLVEMDDYLHKDTTFSWVIMLINIIIRAWSWEKISCSVMGEAVICSLRFNHVVIVVSNESFKTLFVELKSTTLICCIGV